MSAISRVRRYPASSASISALLLLTFVFWSTGTLAPQELPVYARSSLQITGVALMLILLPAYVLAALFVMQRRSLDLVDQLRPQLESTDHADAAVATIRGALRASWPVSAVLGVVLGFFNTELGAIPGSPAPAIDASLGRISIYQ